LALAAPPDGSVTRGIERNAPAILTANLRLTLEDERVTGEEHLLAARGQRIRDARQGQDGELYVVTDEPNGELWKISPRE
jgi:glucose/arabinose dehydrogenase